MEQPTPTQWERFTALRLQLEPLADDVRREALHAARSENPDDARVIALLEVHFAMPQSPTQGIGSGDRVDGFVLGERLGAGSMGVVYEATQSLGEASRSVAIKLINPLLWGMAPKQTRERFADEVKAQADLQYNGLARLYTAGTYEDPTTHTNAPYLVMELVHGAQTITDFVREQKLDIDKRLQLFQRICRAVQHAHDHRIIHRDLKPDNILIDSESRPIVVDFGLAKTVDAVLPGAAMVTSGTIAYMSPEQLSPAFGPISEKTDSYALGVILYELLTGSKPYETSLDDSFEQLTKIISTQTPKLPRGDVEPELEDIVLKVLSKNPSDRPGVGVLGSQLAHYLDHSSVTATTVLTDATEDGAIWSELSRRGVIRVAAGYSIAAFVAFQVAEITFEPLQFPPWAMRSLIITAAVGFPIAVLLAWAFEKTPAGLVRDKRFGGAHWVGGVLVGLSAVALGIFGYALLTRDTATELSSAAHSQSIAERPRGIAVLPFENLSDDPPNAYFAGGIHEEVLSRIARIPDIRVISRTSMVSVAKLGLEVGAIAERLNVSHVLEGSVRRDGERVRITVQLIDPAIDGHLWTESYDRTLDDVFAMQSQIALAIAAQLEVELSPETTARIAEVPTTNKEAHDLYLQALAEENVWRESDTFLAMKPLLEKAVALDPDFLQAQVLLASTYGRLLWTGADPERIYGPKALELVTDIRRRWADRPESLVALADYHYTVERDYERANALYLKALPELPNDTQLIGYLANSYKRLQQFEQSIRYHRKNIELDPESQAAHIELGTVLAYNGQMDEALAQLKMALDRFPDNANIRHAYNQLLLSYRGDVDVYLAAMERLAREGIPCQYSEYIPREAVLYTRGDAAAALANIEVCVTATKGVHQAFNLDWLSMTLLLEGRDAEARETADRALKLNLLERLDVDGSLLPDSDRISLAWLAYFAARAEDWNVYQDYRHRWAEAPVGGYITELYSLSAVGKADALAGNPQDGWSMVEEFIRENPYVSRHTILAQLPYWSYMFSEAPAFQVFIAGTEADAVK